MSKRKTLEWCKACTCKATSSTGAMRISTGRGMDSIIIAVNYYKQASCDNCGKPWQQRAARRKGERL